MIPVVDARQRVFWERRFHSGMALVMLASVFVGFSRTFFLKPWFPDAQQFAPPEPFFFYVHGVSFTAWILLLVLQPVLVASKRVDLHRLVGWFGAGLAVVVVVVGTMGALIAARRPGGFLGVDLFLVPIVVWDVVPRGRVHPVTLFGGLAVVASQPLRILLSETSAWMSFAAWAVGAS